MFRKFVADAAVAWHFGGNSLMEVWTMDLPAAADSQMRSPVRMETPPITCSTDAEVDIQVLKAVPKHFTIENQSSANWLVRRIVSARSYAIRVKEWAEQELRRAEREERTLLFLFGRQIEQWATTEIATLHERKSLNLPAGVIGFRTTAASLCVDDESSVLAWAHNHLPAAVISTPKLSRTVLKDHFQKTGEVPEAGAHIEPACEKFYIR